MDLVAFNGGVNPWGNPFVTSGFRPGAQYFRTRVEKWGFTGLAFGRRCGLGLWAMVGVPRRGQHQGPAATSEMPERLNCHASSPGISGCQCRLRGRRTSSSCRSRTIPSRRVVQQRVAPFPPRAGFLSGNPRVLKPGRPLFLGAYSGIGPCWRSFSKATRRRHGRFPRQVRAGFDKGRRARRKLRSSPIARRTASAKCSKKTASNCRRPSAWSHRCARRRRHLGQIR